MSQDSGSRIEGRGTALPEYLLRLGDDRLVLGHRLSEWCGHGPVLEEDIATANIALDLLGQATMFLRMAGQIEGQGRDEDALAYWRDENQFRNASIAELPRGDFGFTILRQFLFSAWAFHHLGALATSANAELGAVAAKALKETRYHVRHSSEWVLRLGDGTAESHRRAQAALDELWPWTGELFWQDEVDAELRTAGVAPDLEPLRAPWEAMVGDVLARATLTLPAGPMRMSGGRRGRHTEHLGHMLAEMQIVARSHPGAKW
ncbi:MAG TPA: 1,2-phenylacetyl-CoA epoxidase subunit PaaC [Gemmatimonadales bacterium]|nr:1,2-phenylacetyl-CoA epoxidase subunit PaaC [Gemmatimonadales bacterium]